ncbi:MAG: two-component sensor histidine kinase, partial [Cyanobacteriota bacterium]|nr:two-component sensor histidine kinase [Cyanobacteriota bacterium]
MNRNKLFSRTQTQLALSYAGVMGVILSLLGFGVYQAIVHAHIVTVDRELKSVAGTLHDSLEWKLKQPGKLEPIVQNILPNLCLAEVNCSLYNVSNRRQTLSALHQSDYYIRLFDRSGQLVAMTYTFPDGLPQKFNSEYWQMLDDNQGNFYHQISLALHTQDRSDWGYLQVGRSLQDVNDYLNSVKLILGLGLPIAMILVWGASWGLAGLAMQPIYQSYRQ